MPTAVVTGGAGFLGSHLCEHLLERGHRVICIDNLDTGTLENIEHIRDDAFGTLGDNNLKDLKVAGQSPTVSVDTVTDYTTAQDDRIARKVEGQQAECDRDHAEDSCGCGAPHRTGSLASMSVPPPGGLWTPSHPPSASTRSRSPSSPAPLGDAPPRPSSLIVT